MEIRLKKIIFIVLVLTSLFSQASFRIKNPTITLSSEFQMNIMKQLNSNENKNVLISPLSIFMILSLTSNGAVGTTQQEIIKLIGKENVNISVLNAENKNALQLIKGDAITLSNGIFTRMKVNPEFTELAKENYNATVDLLKDANQINAWISQKTNGKIDQIIKEFALTQQMKMILINAIYFKAYWRLQFNESDTKEGEFGENKIPVKMMYKEFKYGIPFYQDDQVQVVELAYKVDNNSSRDIRAVIILPKENINSFLSTLSHKEISDKYIKSLSNRSLKLYLPRFKIEFEHSLKQSLINLGMKVCFSPEAKFDNISANTQLFISDILHKTFMSVDEFGTEAAATTAVIMLGYSLYEPKWHIMNVNRPFLFIARLADEDKFLFLAKVENPN